MRKLDLLFKEIVKPKEITDIPKPTYDLGYFPEEGNELNEYIEYSNLLQKFFQQYRIGTRVSRGYWGNQKYKQIQKILTQQIQPVQIDSKIGAAPKSNNSLQLYDQLLSDVGGKQFSKYDFQRVARTETANMKAVYSLLKYKEAGVIYVIHTTKNDDRVSEICKLHANREFKIDYLLSPEGEKDRIVLHPNCRCFYRTSLRLK